jgi:polyhydroxybutyrate depolymerase
MLQRYYRVYVPARYDPRTPMPLLYVLGGFTVPVYDLASYTEIERTADQNGFIVAYLEQDWRNFGGRIGWVRAWYVYRNEWRPGEWANDPDVDFVRQLTLHLESLYNLDRTRIFASGHSRGAGESIMLAYLLPGMIAGYCSESGFVQANQFVDYIRSYAGARRVPGVFIHGVDDPDVNFAEAETLDAALREHGDQPERDYLFLPLDGVTHRWQPTLNQTFWDFLHAHPLALSEITR